MALLEGLQYETLPPCDWKTIARACSSGEIIHYGKANGINLSEQQARRNAPNAISITVEMLTAEGQYLDLMQQMIFQSQVYQQINIGAMKA